jgi:hypothetical protein
MDLEGHSFNFDNAPWFPRFVEPLVAMKLDTVLCQPTGLSWKRCFDVPRFLLHMTLLPDNASIFLETKLLMMTICQGLEHAWCLADHTPVGIKEPIYQARLALRDPLTPISLRMLGILIPSTC